MRTRPTQPSGTRHRRLAAICLLVPLLASACGRAPIDCAEIRPGDLAISELRGDQSGEDSDGQWIELFNTTDGEIELSGLVLRLLKLNGSGEATIRVRDIGLFVGPRDYAVLGNFGVDAVVPPHVDYPYGDDFDSDLYSDAIIEVIACAELVDRLIYRDLPGDGTLAFDGARTLTAEANDDSAAWCADSPAANHPGTPGEANAACN